MKNELAKRLILEETYFYKGKINDFRREVRLKSKRGFKLDWISEKEFNVFPYFSSGTLVSNVMNFDGIKGEAIITQVSDEKIKIQMKTNVRVEIYFFMIVWAIAFILNFFVKLAPPFLIFLTFPFGLIILWNIYRIQEYLLFKKVKKYIEVELSKTGSQK